LKDGKNCAGGFAFCFSGIGCTYCIIIEQQPAKMVVTKNDQRRVSKKSIIIGDDTGNEAELVMWGPLAARAKREEIIHFRVCAVFQLTIPRHPEGSVVLLRNLKFGSYYPEQASAGFC